MKPVIEEADLASNGESSRDQVLYHVTARQQRPRVEEPLREVAAGDDERAGYETGLR